MGGHEELSWCKAACMGASVFGDGDGGDSDVDGGKRRVVFLDGPQVSSMLCSDAERTICAAPLAHGSACFVSRQMGDNLMSSTEARGCVAIPAKSSFADARQGIMADDHDAGPRVLPW